MSDKQKLINLEKQMNSLAPWYQKINLPQGITTSSKTYRAVPAGEKAWKQIKQLLPPSLKNMRILDLGCNAGYYCIRSSLMGAKDVIGIDKSPTFFPQTSFIKDCFEAHHGPLNIKYIQEEILDVDFSMLGSFDYVYAIAIIYHIGKGRYGKYTVQAQKAQSDVIGKIAKVSKNFIVRTRNSQLNNVAYYDKMFSKFGLKNKKTLAHGKRSMVLYGK